MSRQVPRAHPSSKSWQARVKRAGMSFYIGHFHTKAEADAAEDAFRVKRGWDRTDAPFVRVHPKSGTPTVYYNRRKPADGRRRSRESKTKPERKETEG